MEIGIFHRHLGFGMPAALISKFGVKTDIETTVVVEKFLITKQWRVGPDRLQKQGLSPTRMGAYQVGSEAFRLELLSCTGTALSTDNL